MLESNYILTQTSSLQQFIRTDLIKLNLKFIWTVIASALLLVFIASIFANIGHPLLWNDESETAMYGSRILDYGYPKVHDANNVSIYLLPDPIAIKQNIDAYVGTSWAQFYVAAIGVSLAKQAHNFFTKTALIRIPFAIAGLLGICILGLWFSKFFENIYRRRIFQSLFLLLELLSVSLVLHLREVRYYPLLILAISLLVGMFIRHNFFKKYSPGVYIALMTGALVFSFLVFYPIYFAFLATFGLWEIYQASRLIIKNNTRLNIKTTWEVVKSFRYFLLSILVVVPLLVFFKNFAVAEVFKARMGGNSFNLMYSNINSALYFFKNYEFLLLYLTARGAALSLAYFSKQTSLETKLKLKVTGFLSLFVVCYFAAVSNVPFFFERYYIGLQPILTILMLFDLIIIFELLSASNTNVKKETIILTIIFIGLFAYSAAGKVKLISGHIYEVFHPYQGPLDYAIPYIKDNFTDTKDLVIATDYEELTYQYYLGSRTIIGQFQENVKADQKLSPDIIIPRNLKYSPENSKHHGIYDGFFTKAAYRKIAFPVQEYPYNNIPELDYSNPHLFKTLTPDQANAFTIYIKNIR